MEDSNDGMESNEQDGMEIEFDDADAVGKPATALLEAVRNNDLESCRALIASGVDINEVSGSPERTALIYAAEYGYREIVALLIQFGADVSAQADEGLSALYLASVEGKVEVVDMLLQAGASPGIQDDNNVTPLHGAAYLQHPEVVELLIKAGADVNARDCSGAFPLGLAAEAGSAPIVEMLLKAGANAKMKSSAGYDALLMATVYKHFDVQKLLLDFQNATPS